MKYTSLAVLIGCAVLSGQTAPDDAAAKRLEDRLKKLNLLPPPGKLVLTGRVSGPCAIPLLTFVPKGNYKMAVTKPPAERSGEVKNGGEVQVPAPACDQKLFPNK